ncbi:hypothetical protein AB0L75_36745 [Streptomyces sp. NPDC052101]|uniref:hypothetical protein n=1 Tax=Streptomyces sp. NPDC052101 TaxID=3155763 RepID=UPI00342AF039
MTVRTKNAAGDDRPRKELPYRLTPPEVTWPERENLTGPGQDAYECEFEPEDDDPASDDA